MNSKIKILVTGGAGYIGSILVPELLRLGHTVTVYDSLMYGSTSLVSSCKFKNFNFIYGNVTDELSLSKIVKDFDLVIPLAAIVGAPACSKNPTYARSVNYDSMMNLLACMSKNQMIIYPTTNSGYGIGDQDKECTEESELKPLSQYALEKVEVEKIILDRGNAITFRLATVFGASPRMRIDLLVNDFTFKACTDGYLVLFEPHFRRNFIHVSDVAGAFIFALEHYEAMANNSYNVGLSSANLTKAQLALKIKSQVEKLAIFYSEDGKDPDKRDYIVSNSKLEKLGWVANVTLEDGISELIQYYKMLKMNNYRNA